MENVKHQRKEGVMVVLENNELKIKSTELVEIINEFRKLESETRKSKYVELRHNDFMAKIKKELEVLKLLDLEGERNFSHGSYIDKQNQARPCFELNRDGMLQMLNSESTLVRYKTIQYINTLENKIKGQAITQLKPLTTEEMLELQFKYAKEVKEFKANPGMYKAHVGDVSTVLRVALTSRTNTPDMYEIMQVLGKNRIAKRFEVAKTNLK